MTELWRAAFGGCGLMLERDLDMVVAEAQLRFRAPARFDQELSLDVAVTHLGTTSMVTQHVIVGEASGPSEVVRGSLRHVFVDPQTLAKKPIPEWLRAGLGPWTVAGP